MLKSTEYYQPRAPHPRRPAAELITGLVQATSHNRPTDPWRRIRCAKDCGLRNLPLHGYAQNQIWCEITAMACELLAWLQMLAFTGPARRWEPKRLRLRIFAVAGRLVRGGRRLRLRLAARWP